MGHLGTLEPLAWLSRGDYNETIEDAEKVDGSLKPMGQMAAFRETLEKCRLVDLCFNGPRFTWNNGQDGADFIMERLDHVVANMEWQDLFVFYKVDILASRFFDHAPIMLTFQKNSQHIHRRGGLFCYEMAGRKCKQWRELIRKVWRVK